jgi:hypothetical protein
MHKETKELLESWYEKYKWSFSERHQIEIEESNLEFGLIETFLKFFSLNYFLTRHSKDFSYDVLNDIYPYLNTYDIENLLRSEIIIPPDLLEKLLRNNKDSGEIRNLVSSENDLSILFIRRNLKHLNMYLIARNQKFSFRDAWLLRDKLLLGILENYKLSTRFKRRYERLYYRMEP